MADLNKNDADNFGNPTVEEGGSGLDTDATGAGIGDGTGVEIKPLDDQDGETLADKADLIEADSILDPVPTEGGGLMGGGDRHQPQWPERD